MTSKPKSVDWTNKKFAAFILTHGRPDRVITYGTLRRCGYTGPIYLICDNEDKRIAEYEKSYPGQVIIFDKLAISKTFDQADNFNDRRAIVYARNASFEIAEDLGLDYFVQLDDDYVAFEWRFNSNLNYITKKNKSMDAVFSSLLDFLVSTNIESVAMAQGGDFIGGSENKLASRPYLSRKCMNSFFCSLKKPVQFIGRINEDVNTYTHQASLGQLFFTTNHVNLVQMQTQKNAGGMTDLYLSSGTYVKSFYTVIFQPSSVCIRPMGDKYYRLHHSINWNNTVPKILPEDVKKLG